MEGRGKAFAVEEARVNRRGRPWSNRRKVFNGILWICARVRLGKICRRDMAHTKPRMGASRTGCVQAFWLKFCWRWRNISKTPVGWI